MAVVGSIMLDVNSTELTNEDKTLLLNPLVGGLILFARNFGSAEQVLQLTQEIKAINPSILIAVDQEGGRVQRFTHGFSKLPSLGLLGQLYKKNQPSALDYAFKLGELMALEVQSVGCDISFAPVLDLGHEFSEIIGMRAFSTNSADIVVIAQAYIKGMNSAGMLSTGKHFPGHGSIVADSHVSIPIDERDYASIKNDDLKVFAELSSQLGAIMPAHIIYPQIDQQPAGFSKIWLQDILRNELNFDGVIFSDDLSMKGAEVAGSFSDRAKLALAAGCDMVLICNDRQAVLTVLEELEGFKSSTESQQRLSKLQMSSKPMGLSQLKETPKWQQLNTQLIEFNQLFKE